MGVMERSGNLRKDLNEDILETVNSHRDYCHHEQTNLEAKTAALKQLEKEVEESKDAEPEKHCK
jgi:hypothetical protein